ALAAPGSAAGPVAAVATAPGRHKVARLSRRRSRGSDSPASPGLAAAARPAEVPPERMTGRPDDAGVPGMAAAHPLGFAPDAADATQPIPVITEPVQQAVSRTDAPAAAGPDRPGSATGAPAARAS